ncbi:hypothetical protein JZ751_026211 [Albula glossodonta]|uniref:ubiquitinyl hydrolase 1 n=1 Tax=Albula glossodonta TaxID=121402 RepID=A0A8T2PK05_9TELE|nr:hypothetical protein JZ751_026211 [Albula glossodonta]
MATDAGACVRVVSVLSAGRPSALPFPSYVRCDYRPVKAGVVPLYVTVVYQGKCSHCMRIGVAVPLTSTVSRLREAVSQETKIPIDQPSRFKTALGPCALKAVTSAERREPFVSERAHCDPTPTIRSLCLMLPAVTALHANLNQNNLKYGTENNRTSPYLKGAVKPGLTNNKNAGADKIILLVCNRACSGHQGRSVGQCAQLASSTVDGGGKEILEKMRHLLRPGVFIQVGPFSLRVVGVVGITYLLPQEEQPLCHPSVESGKANAQLQEEHVTAVTMVLNPSTCPSPSPTHCGVNPGICWWVTLPPTPPMYALFRPPLSDIIGWNEHLWQDWEMLDVHSLTLSFLRRAYKSCGPGGPPHVKIVVEWDKETKDYLFGHTEDEYIPDAESVRLQKEVHHQPQTCTLAQCFQLYTKEEQLAPDDAWRCPHCKQLQQGSIKLSLWTLPDILILHLKRFRQHLKSFRKVRAKPTPQPNPHSNQRSDGHKPKPHLKLTPPPNPHFRRFREEGDRRMKMQNMVKFPLVGMDMAPHMVKRSQSSWSLPSHWSPWRRPYGMGRDPEDYLYDLYAVCNHHGTMQGGHYTAYCKNSIDGQWYCFDDSDVQPISDDQVCKQTAYILFYQRRATIPSWSANSSVAGSTSSSLCEHWVNRLPGSKQPSVASAASSRRTSLASLSESVEFTGERSEDDGGFSTRPFVRSVQRQSSSSRSSIASPLAVSENGVKPSWSLTAKLHMRSNSPSRFSLDSHSSATLERIGEAGDDKVSTSCFGSYSKHERQSGGKAPLAMMEGVTSDDGSSRRSLDEPYCKAPSQADKRSSKAEPVDNNNQAAPMEQTGFSKELKHRSSSGGSTAKAENTGAKRASTKVVAEPEKSSKKRQASTSTHSSPASQASASPQAKSSVKVSTSKDKSDSTKTSRGSSTGTPTKKEPAQGQEAVLTGAALQKQRTTSMAQSTALPSPTRRKTLTAAERSAASGRSKLAERTGSRDSTRTSPLADKPPSAGSARTGGTPRSSLPRPESRTVKSSSSSSSVTSLRSPSVSSKDLRRSSKSEDKGLSFFKSALRQKETRRSADFGKSAILTKKTSEGTARSGAEAKSSTSEAGEGAGKTSRQVSPEPKAGKASAKLESSKTSTPAKRSLLSPGKSKSSTAETGALPPANGKKPLDKTVSSRKLSSSMQSSARPIHKPQ